ncbi:hypothetical protein QTL95_09305 [Rhizobium sp. S152]|uniref:PGF-CTERM protein n=1 Tax=Halobaculum lipolyticum TaxID=3032001 RepID=A0ABD5WDT9_9EURY|nr:MULTISPECIES: hypothetical protein [Bacteria]MDM9626093.1 hypothetical protein [Rhizobium sp. S152]
MRRLGQAGGFALVLALVAAVLLGAVGGVAAADVSLTNETVAVDGDTQSVYAQVNASDATTDANVTVEWVGIDADGNETGTLDTRNVTVPNGTTETVKYESVDPTAYDSVRVTVMLDNTTASADNVSASAGAIQMVAGGGGGGLLDGTDRTTIGAGVVVLLGIGLFLRSGEE